MDGFDRAVAALGKASRVVALTGAGISAESGLRTFRDAGGLWEGHRPEDVATPQAFARDPALLWRFYNSRRDALRSVQPNSGHHALVELESLIPRFYLITQNVDRLHTRAGSSKVIELHGNLDDIRCSRCRVERSAPGIRLPDLPRCEACGGLMRPAVVWFGEQLPSAAIAAAQRAAAECQVFLTIGTSAQVYPAAGLAHVAADCGATVIEINLRPSDAADLADVHLHGPSGEILPRLVQALKAARQ